MTQATNVATTTNGGATPVAGTTRRKGRASKQDWRTPLDLLAAIEARFGKVEIDLACDASNAVAPKSYAHPAVDSLSVEWAELHTNSVLFLNPPFSEIDPWAAKCAHEAAKIADLGGDGLILLLTPASVASNWFADHVHRKALVLPLLPRLTFRESDGSPCADPYPKDCMLSVFGVPHGFEPWRYKPEEARAKRTRDIARCTAAAPPGWACRRRPKHKGACAIMPITAAETLPGIA